YQDFLARRGDDAALKAEVAAAWFRVGQIQGLIGTVPEALAAYERAIALGEELLAAEPANFNLQANLARWYSANAWSLRMSGRFAEALDHSDRAAALADGLSPDHPQRPLLVASALTIRSDGLATVGDTAGAIPAAERAEALVARSAQDPKTQRTRATNLVRLGLMRRSLKRLAEAADALRQARRVYEDSPTEPGVMD